MINSVKFFRILLRSVFMCCLSLPLAANALTAKEIMQNNDALPDGETSLQENVLVIIKSGREQIKKFGTVFKRYDEKRRMRMSFTFPTRLEFLVWDEPGTDSLQWLKMSSGRVRKISTSDKGNSWVSSDFYNEDISEFNISDHEYTLLGEVEVDGVPCYQVQSEKLFEPRVYSKRIHYISKQDFVLRRVDFYEDGKHRKTLTLQNIELIEGVYTPRKAVMERTDGKSKSILYLKSVQYNQPVADQKLTRETF